MSPFSLRFVVFAESMRCGVVSMATGAPAVFLSLHGAGNGCFEPTLRDKRTKGE